jgi:tetratricopeptide (TPR) repeat protein
MMLGKLLAGILEMPAKAWRARRDRRQSADLGAALALFEQRKFQAVVDECTTLISQGRAAASANHLCGRAYLALGNREPALRCLEAAAAIAPDKAEVQADLATARRMAGDLAGAVESCRRAMALRPDNIDDRLQLVEILEMVGQREDAVAELLAVQELAPGRHDLLLRAFNAVSGLGLFSEALRIAERAVLEQGESGGTLRLLASARYGCADMRGAVEACRKATALQDNQPDLHVTLGSALFALGSVEEAVDAYARALEIRPDHPDALFHLGLINLMRGNYREGWPGFEQRYRRARRRAVRPCQPAWDGRPLAEGNLLVMREQGLGDEIMFSSCYQEVIRLARRVAFECDPRLQKLLSRSFPGATFCPLQDLETTGQTDPGFSVDARVYAGSLPHHLRNEISDFPRHAGYLQPDPERVAHWRGRLFALGPGLKVGVSWRGGTVFTRQERRSLSLQMLLPVLSVPGVRWVNLQYGQRSDDIAALQQESGIEIVDWPEAIDGDYDETAALVSALDLVISVCTSVVHLTGALGRPAWVMTARVPEWRYGLHGSTMPWYPQVRLFRQATQGDWGPVVSGIERALRQRLDASVDADRLNPDR